MSKDKKKLQVPSPSVPDGNKPFAVGFDNPVGLYNNLKLHPVFSFTNINLNGGKFCYNNPALEVDHYHKLFERLKLIGRKTYNELQKEGVYWRFHDVNFEDDNVSVSFEEFKKAVCLNPEKVSNETVPTCYQFEVSQLMRAMGYLGNNGIFYLVWFDPEHDIYS